MGTVYFKAVGIMYIRFWPPKKAPDIETKHWNNTNKSNKKTSNKPVTGLELV